MNLEFTAKRVAAFEKQKKVPLANTLSAITDIDSLLEFIKLGSAEGMSDDDAYAVIDAERKAGKSTQEMSINLIETLEEQGFLEKSLGMSTKVRAKIQELAKSDSLDNIGESMNLQQ